MIVTCQSCLKHYSLDETRIKPTGSKVQCSQCKEIFTVYPPDKEPIALGTAPPVEITPVTTTTQPFVVSKIADEDVVPPEVSSDDVRIDFPETDDVSIAASDPILAFQPEKDPDLADAEDESPKTLSADDDEDDLDSGYGNAKQKGLPAHYSVITAVARRGLRCPGLAG